MLDENIIPVHVEGRLDALPIHAHSMPVNLYHTERYLVINASLPRCLPEKVHVSLAPAQLVITAERHPGEPLNEARDYILSELPDGAIGRVLDLPPGEWVYDDAEAHFANGLLTVSIPTQARSKYLHQMQAP